MPKLGGIELNRRAQRSAPDTAILLYTGYGDRALLTEALDAGVRGFVLKEAPMDDLLRALHAVADGRTYVDPVLAGTLAASSVGSALPQLTQRERDVLRLLADGLSNEEIGKRLFISAETVRTHVRKAMDKLDADTRTQAVARALRDAPGPPAGVEQRGVDVHVAVGRVRVADRSDMDGDRARQDAPVEARGVDCRAHRCLLRRGAAAQVEAAARGERRGREGAEA